MCNGTNFHKTFQVSIFKVVPMGGNAWTHSLERVGNPSEVLCASLLVYQETPCEYIIIGNASLICYLHFFLSSSIQMECFLPYLNLTLYASPRTFFVERYR